MVPRHPSSSHHPRRSYPRLLILCFERCSSGWSTKTKPPAPPARERKPTAARPARRIHASSICKRSIAETPSGSRRSSPSVAGRPSAWSAATQRAPPGSWSNTQTRRVACPSEPRACRLGRPTHRGVKHARAYGLGMPPAVQIASVFFSHRSFARSWSAQRLADQPPGLGRRLRSV